MKNEYLNKNGEKRRNYFLDINDDEMFDDDEFDFDTDDEDKKNFLFSFIDLTILNKSDNL